jgi:hypothetical protein
MNIASRAGLFHALFTWQRYVHWPLVDQWKIPGNNTEVGNRDVGDRAHGREGSDVKNTSNPETLQGPPRSIERRHFERPYAPTCGWIGQRVGTPEEVAELKGLLAFSAQQMALLRSRNEQLMAVNSDLRYKLGEITVRWVDLCRQLDA